MGILVMWTALGPGQDRGRCIGVGEGSMRTLASLAAWSIRGCSLGGSGFLGPEQTSGEKRVPGRTVRQPLVRGMPEQQVLQGAAPHDSGDGLVEEPSNDSGCSHDGRITPLIALVKPTPNAGCSEEADPTTPTIG